MVLNRHENEVRLVYNGVNNVQDKLFKFNVNPLDLIDEIVFDPRIDEVDDDLLRVKKEKIMSWGYKNKVIKSGLYAIKNYRVLLNDSL